MPKSDWVRIEAGLYHNAKHPSVVIAQGAGYWWLGFKDADGQLDLQAPTDFRHTLSFAVAAFDNFVRCPDRYTQPEYFHKGDAAYFVEELLKREAS